MAHGAHRGKEVAPGGLDHLPGLFYLQGVGLDFRPLAVGGLETFLDGFREGTVSQDVLHFHWGVDRPPQEGVEAGLDDLQAVFRPDEIMLPVGELNLRLEEIVFRNQSDVEEVPRLVPVGLKLLHRLAGNAEDLLRLEDLEIGAFHLLDNILGGGRFIHPGDVLALPVGLVVGQDGAAGEEGLAELQGPTVIVLGAHGDRTARRRQGGGKDGGGNGHGRHVGPGRIVEAGVAVRGAEFGQKAREGLLFLGLRPLYAFLGRLDDHALFQGHGHALRQGDPAWSVGGSGRLHFRSDRRGLPQGRGDGKEAEKQGDDS